MRRNKVHRHGEKETHDAETNHRLQALRGSRAFHLPKVYHFLFVLFSFFLSFFLSSLLLLLLLLLFVSILLYYECGSIRDDDDDDDDDEREREREREE